MFLVIIVLIFRSLLAPTWVNGLITLIVGFTAVSWVSLARLIHIYSRQIKTQLFVEASIALGASTLADYYPPSLAQRAACNPGLDH